MLNFRQFALSIAFVILMPASVFAADNDEAVIGTWELNVAKSTFSPGPGPRSQTVTHTATPQGITYTSNGVNAQGNPAQGTFTYVLDGPEVPSGANAQPNQTIQLKRTDPMTVVATSRRDGVVVSVNTRVMAADGKSYTLNVKGTNAQGQPTNNMLVFERR